MQDISQNDVQIGYYEDMIKYEKQIEKYNKRNTDGTNNSK